MSPFCARLSEVCSRKQFLLASFKLIAIDVDTTISKSSKPKFKILDVFANETRLFW